MVEARVRPHDRHSDRPPPRLVELLQPAQWCGPGANLRLPRAVFGWGDIGYSFLIDRYGTVYEGRKGGAGDPVVAGHTYGFNHATIGIALIGTFSRSSPPAAMRSSLTKLVT